MYSHYFKLAPAEEISTAFNSKNKHEKNVFLAFFFGWSAAKKCTKIYNARAELLFCLTTFWLPLPSFFAVVLCERIHCTQVWRASF